MWKKFLNLLANPFNNRFIIALIVINFFGSIYGYYWYQGQLVSTPARYLLFVPDSPFSTTLMTFALLLILLKRRNSLLELFACTGVIKYGIWAAVINFHYGLTGGNFDIINFALATSHLGMAIEGFVFIRHVKINKIILAITIAWMILNDYMDYVVGIHPYLFSDNQLGIAMGTALLMTVGLTLYMIYLSYLPVRVRQNANT